MSMPAFVRSHVDQPEPTIRDRSVTAGRLLIINAKLHFFASPGRTEPDFIALMSPARVLSRAARAEERHLLHGVPNQGTSRLLAR